MKLRFSDGFTTAVEFEAADYEYFRAEAREALRQFRTAAHGRIAYLHIWGGHTWYNPGRIESTMSSGINPGNALNFWEPQQITWSSDATPPDEWFEDALVAVNQTARWLAALSYGIDALMDRVDALGAEMTVEEVAKTYGIQSGTVRRSIHMGWIPARKSGKNWLIRRRDAEARWGKRIAE